MNCPRYTQKQWNDATSEQRQAWVNEESAFEDECLEHALGRGTWFEMSQWGGSYSCEQCDGSGGGQLAVLIVSALAHAKAYGHETVLKIHYTEEPYTVTWAPGKPEHQEHNPIARDYDPRKARET